MGVQDCDGRAGDLAVIGSGDGFRRIFEAAPLAMLICRLNGDFICANPAFYRLLRLEPAAPLAHSCDFVYADDVAAEHEFIRNAGRVPADRIRYRRGDGTVVDVERHAAVLPTECGGCLVIQIIDATRQKQQESAMRFLALHDPLTGLGNRLQFQERLAEALRQAEQEQTGAAVIFLDLDQFKLINDTNGHQAGDQALREIGRRIAGCVRKNDTVARLGGDEFVVLLPTVSCRLQAEAIAKKMVRAIKEPLILSGCQFSLQASAGVAVYPGDGSDADLLIAAADAAMYRCKRG